jgi:RNA polymerase subunit RPABC4/transcription elongation factor Spt4
MLVSDLCHFLAYDGNIAPKTGPAKRMAEYLASIVIIATNPTQTSHEINCRKRPNRKPCLGKLRTKFISPTSVILWRCPVCGDQGSISNWQGSFWDCTNKSQLH